ncbi:MAG: glycosyltransferase [Actinomycetia bacterium]|nr:glycosyltransferase [Actinomycetes bacterium]
MTRVVWCVTSPVTVRAFLREQVAYLKKFGITPTVISADDGEIAQEVPRFVPWRIEREPSAGADARALKDLTSTLRQEAPEVIVVGTPKASLLGMLSAVAARVPRRIYVVHGLRFEGFVGWRRRAMQSVEVLIATLATDVVAVSPSVAGKLRALLPRRVAAKVRVLRHGSADGIDAARFFPADAQERSALRRRLGLPEDAHVVVFIGRLTADKGLSALCSVADRLHKSAEDAVLVVIGELDTRSETEIREVTELLAAPSVRHVERTSEAEAWLRAADVVAQPTRREGMPNVVLEAQFSGVPVVSCAVTGVIDAIEDDVSGVLVPWGQDEEFSDAVLALLADPDRRRRLAETALARARERFDQTALRDAWADLLLEGT